jgi:precorrin-2/cobalt-factor-2 C20-methyltransferase
MEKGTLYCVSVGPGDPELLTLKASRILHAVPVVAAPVTHGEKTMALDIVRQSVSLEGKQIMLLDFPMSADREKLALSHRSHAAALAEQLQQGRDVAFVCIGDVSVFSTVTYVSDLLAAQGFRTEMIPGVTSFCACACALGQSLTSMRSPLHVFPGSFTDTEAALAMDGVKVFMKSGRKIDAVRKSIQDAGLPASAVVDCGLSTQAVYRNLSDMPENAGYFTTLIVGEKS